MSFYCINIFVIFTAPETAILSSMSKLIFFIDDDKMILNLLEYTFQARQDYDVVCYQTGEECLENIIQKPSLIVLDHVLEGMGDNTLNGMETLIEIRKVDKEVPVVILTGQGDERLLTKFMEAGASRYLTKDDFFIDSLIETIQQVLS
jgi:DNA-binding response OmpR family regulator